MATKKKTTSRAPAKAEAAPAEAVAAQPGPEPDEEEAKDAKYYCPACGRRYETKVDCVGSPEGPHAPCEVVSTKELDGDPEKQTAAPNTGEL